MVNAIFQHFPQEYKMRCWSEPTIGMASLSNNGLYTVAKHHVDSNAHYVHILSVWVARQW